MGDIAKFLVTESRLDVANFPPRYPPRGIFDFILGEAGS